MFCAQQGFVGAFSERILDNIEDDLSTTSLFLIGTRGQSITAARGLHPVWSPPMEAMSAAGSQITRKLGEFEATLRRVRQEAITAEIIELGTGTASAHGAR